MINWEDINLKNKTSGVVKTVCPNCSHTRKKPKDPCLYVNISDGVAKCFNCEELGFKEPSKPIKTKKIYSLPPQEWQNYTNLSDGLIKWFESRKIQQFTIKHFRITEEFYYQPAIQQNQQNVVFNYFERDSLVNKKYRDVNKNYTQTKGGKPIMYNIDSLYGQEEAYIVEGEIEAMVLHQEGYKNVISLPNGANNNDDFWLNSEPYLKDIKHFYIATDNDEKGDIVAENIAHRLGKYRCSRIKWQNKDANEDLIAGVFNESINCPIEYPVSGTIKHSEIYDDVMRFLEEGTPQTIKPKSQRFKAFNEVFSILMGQLTTVTGIPSHGKSNFIEDYTLDLISSNDMKLSIFSPEHNPLTRYAPKLASKALGLNIYDNKEQYIKYSNWAEEKVYYTTFDKRKEPEYDAPTWDWLISTMEAQMLRYGANIFIIDAWNKVIMNKGDKGEIDRVLTRLTSFVQTYNVHIFLVAHPTKMQKNKEGNYEVPDLYDVSGSADFRNQTHNGLCVYRDFERKVTTVVNLKTKESYQGEIGGYSEFIYDTSCGRYNGTDCMGFDNVSMIDNTQLVKVDTRNNIVNLNPNEAFLNQQPTVPYEQNINNSDWYNEPLHVTDSDDEIPF